MTDPLTRKTGFRTASDGDASTAPPNDSNQAPRDLSPEQLSRWAKLVSEGQEPFPEGLRPAQQERMLQQTRYYRRLRLVRYIARQIASDIAGGPGRQHGGQNVETQD